MLNNCDQHNINFFVSAFNSFYYDSGCYTSELQEIVKCCQIMGDAGGSWCRNQIEAQTKNRLRVTHHAGLSLSESKIREKKIENNWRRNFFC